EQEEAFAAVAASLRVFDRAELARQRGLGGRARDVLLESDISAFGAEGMALELQLLLDTGRAKEVREWTDPGQKEDLGPSYHWLRAQALAAEGDYALAEDECGQLAGEGPGIMTVRPQAALAGVIGHAVLAEQPGPGSLGSPFIRVWSQAALRTRLANFTRNVRQEADGEALRGVLALEAGEVAEAAVAFRAALAVWKDEASAATGAGIDFSGRAVAQGCLTWLE